MHPVPADSVPEAADAAIVRVGPLFYIMAGLPALHSQTTTLILPEALLRNHEFLPESARGRADIIYSDDGSYFALMIEPRFELGGKERARFVDDVLRHAWAGLVSFGFVSGEMPEPVVGDPRRMLP